MQSRNQQAVTWPAGIHVTSRQSPNQQAWSHVTSRQGWSQDLIFFLLSFILTFLFQTFFMVNKFLIEELHFVPHSSSFFSLSLCMWPHFSFSYKQYSGHTCVGYTFTQATTAPSGVELPESLSIHAEKDAELSRQQVQPTSHTYPTLLEKITSSFNSKWLSVISLRIKFLTVFYIIIKVKIFLVYISKSVSPIAVLPGMSGKRTTTFVTISNNIRKHQQQHS